MTDVRPFKINISDAELDILRKKLELARLPEGDAEVEWAEDNGVTLDLMRSTIDYWRNTYSWRAAEAKLNEMPQFKTTVQLEGTEKRFDPVEVHFAHVKCGKADAIPMLFIHGWPGNFAEVQKCIPMLTAAGFDVVSPSLMGYGWSSLPRQTGFNFFHHGQVFHQLMLRLGYEKYVVQGGDWGSAVGRLQTLQYPEHVQVYHTNMIMNLEALKDADDPTLTDFERNALTQHAWFRENETAYQKVHVTKPRTLGFALHDSPVGMLAWMTDKMNLWADTANLPGGRHPPEDLITWTLLHYWPGPTTAMQMYRANISDNFFSTLTQEQQAMLSGARRLETPTGVSAFPKEVAMVPRKRAEKDTNIVFWREHSVGGHFAAWERPEEMATDMIECFKANWKASGKL